MICNSSEIITASHGHAVFIAGIGSSSSSLWELMGNSMVMTQFIRLTPDVQSKQGAVWNRVVRLALLCNQIWDFITERVTVIFAGCWCNPLWNWCCEGCGNLCYNPKVLLGVRTWGKLFNTWENLPVTLVHSSGFPGWGGARSSCRVFRTQSKNCFRDPFVPAWKGIIAPRACQRPLEVLQSKIFYSYLRHFFKKFIFQPSRDSSSHRYCAQHF